MSKIAVGDDVIPNGGPRVEAGDIVSWSDWVMGRSRAIWGPDAPTWRPERWIVRPDEKEGGSGEEQVRTETQWKFHAFNGGPRLWYVFFTRLSFLSLSVHVCMDLSGAPSTLPIPSYTSYLLNPLTLELLD